MNIGNKLYELRKDHNLSQEEVAEKLNVTRQTISKWETNQSMPDLDKIVPICELYGISSDTLLKGTTKIEQKEVSRSDNSIRKEKAKIISISVFLYFISVIWIIISESLKEMNENIKVSIFLLICAFATVYLIYKFMSFPKEKIEKPKKYKALDEMISLIFTFLYLVVSFITHAWGITWIIWIIYALVIEIIHSILDLRENLHEG